MNLLSTLFSEPSFLTMLNASDQIVSTLQAYIGPLLLVAIAIFSIKFIKDQQFMGLLGFVAIALIVIIIFYTPGILKTIASSFAGETKISTSGTATPNP